MTVTVVEAPAASVMLAGLTAIVAPVSEPAVAFTVQHDTDVASVTDDDPMFVTVNVCEIGNAVGERVGPQAAIDAAGRSHPVAFDSQPLSHDVGLCLKYVFNSHADDGQIGSEAIAR